MERQLPKMEEVFRESVGQDGAVPCPICGKEPSIVQQDFPSWFVMCPDDYDVDDGKANFQGTGNNEQEAIESWNESVEIWSSKNPGSGFPDLD